MKCRCCNGSHVEKFLDLGRQAWGNDFIPIKENRHCEEYPLEVFFCHDCTMVQIGYTVPRHKMFVNHAYLSGTTKSLKEHFVRVAKDIDERVDFDADDYVFDIGGNDGTFLEYFRDKPLKVLNVDSGVLQAKLSNEKGIPCLNTFFNLETARDIIVNQGKAKVIHGSGIFFHLEELHSVFAGIKEMLKLDGLLVAEFIYLPGMIKNCAYDQIYHEHLLYYTLVSFQNLLSRYRLRIFDAYLTPIHGGSCIACIGHEGERQETSALEAMISAERKEGFDRLDVYAGFRDRAKANQKELLCMIKELKAKGKSIQALGAPVKGSTILNSCHLTEKEIDCAVELNIYKCGTYYPGTRIPVCHQDTTPPPDVYLLLSWNFKDEILRKISSFREKGGKVLIPIPVPELM